jgi:type 1 glutamine amidotransferase
MLSRMTFKPVALLLAALTLSSVPAAAPRSVPQAGSLRIFLRGGPKTHGPAGNGLHDHERWVKEWQPLLSSRGARVEGGLGFPTAADLANTDVLVMFAANAGTILGDDRANLEAFLKRGGGIVCLHDCIVTAQEPHWFKTIIGGSWENRVAKYFEGENTYYYVNAVHPITQGAANFTINDEVYWDLHMMPEAHILAASMLPVRPARGAQPAPPPGIGTLIPQIWTYQHRLEGGQPYRAFVSLLGHHFTTFESAHVRGILLRGIAWAAGRDVNTLAAKEEIEALK